MLRRIASLFTRLFGLFSLPARRQVAALCWRKRGGETEILLVTTRNTGRWTPPRGWLMKGKTLAEAAAVEALEEAGAVGVAAEPSLGVYRYDKLATRGGAGQWIDVTVFPLRVEKLIDHHKEAGQRKRRWMPREEAAAAVNEPELQKLIRRFNP